MTFLSVYLICKYCTQNVLRPFLATFLWQFSHEKGGNYCYIDCIFARKAVTSIWQDKYLAHTVLMS